jgi:hypothetical protein
MKSLNFKKFNVFWANHCINQTFGSAIISKDALESESDWDIPMIWAENRNLKTRIVSFLVASDGRLEEYTFLAYPGKKDRHGRILDRKFFGRVRGTRFHNMVFSNEIIKSLTQENFTDSIDAYMKNKIKEIRSDYSLILAQECIANRPNRKATTSQKDTGARSVRTISGGLYGLGKNRKH